MTASTKPSIFSHTRQEMEAYFQELGVAKFRTSQFCDWFFEKKVFDLNAMSNLPKTLKESLAEAFDWNLPTVTDKLDGSDGATKLLIEGARGQLYEAVILRYENRVSLCVSSQVGCKLACSFCQTGKLGFFRNLTAGEIIGQYALAQQIVHKEGRRTSHIVFMGMGEPLDNYANVTKAVNILVGEKEFNLSSRHVTISTSGMVPRIKTLTEDVNAALAISLHACRDELRSELMPINRKYNLEKLKDSLMYFQKQTGKKITIEYILIGNTNCGLREAKELVKFIHGLRVKVNLIPFNSHPGLPWDRPTEEQIRNFQKYLSDRSIPAPVRYSKGLDVSAACGQLAAKALQNLHSAPARKNVIQPATVALPAEV